VTDRSRRSVVLALIGHVGLILAIVADFYRRSSEGGLATLLSVVGLAALVAGGILFVRNPRLFFFGTEGNATDSRSSSMILRMLAWAFVVGVPVLWIIAIDWLKTSIPSGLGVRLVGSYMFFAWVAMAIILSSTLFMRQSNGSGNN
jgi:hypothetical protein